MDPKGVFSDFSPDLLNMELLLLSLLRECSVCGMSLRLQEQHCAVLKFVLLFLKVKFLIWSKKYSHPLSPKAILSPTCVQYQLNDKWAWCNCNIDTGPGSLIAHSSHAVGIFIFGGAWCALQEDKNLCFKVLTF